MAAERLLWREEKEERKEKSGREASLDWMRGIVMCLVFYGHFVERLAYLHTQKGVFLAPLQHFRCIYSFHMPLALFNAGCAETLRASKGSWRSFLFSRPVPYFFGCFLFFLAVGVLPRGDYICYHLDTPSEFIYAVWSTVIHGISPVNTPLWFLSFLTSVHLLYFVVDATFHPGVSVALIPLLLCLGHVGTHNQKIFPLGNFWFLHEAPIGLAFFLLGHVVFSYRRIFRQLSEKIPFLGLSSSVLLFSVVFATYDLNQQFGSVEHFPGQLPAVLMILNTHGSLVWFALTSVAGIFAVFFLSEFLSSVVCFFPFFKVLNESIFEFVGKYSLAFLILHAIPYHYTFHRIAELCSVETFSSNFRLFLLSSAVTSLHLLLLTPLVLLLTSGFPQLLGKPRASGPFIPALL